MPIRDKEMGAVQVLSFLLILVLLSVIGYFIYLKYQRRHEQLVNNNPTTLAGPIPPPPQVRNMTMPAPGLPAPAVDLIVGGTPQPQGAVVILKNRGYISGYSEVRKNPLFVAYAVISPPPFAAGPRPGKFKADLRTDSRVAHEDYTGSGFDRGHMAPNNAVAISFGPDAQDETFLMTNICPQRPILNQKVWEFLERKEVDDYAKRFGHINVLDGPIFDDAPQTIGLKKVQVPVAFYKILIETKSAGSIRAFAVIMPQTAPESDRGNINKYTATIREIESKTQINFFPDLPQQEQDKLETAKSDAW
jgi:endonuclease G